MSQQFKAKKTQILITDIPKEKFTNGWPKTIEKILFDDNFSNLKPNNLEYFTPLPFLNRIVIIMNNEESTLKIFNYLKNNDIIKKPIKIFLTESLLMNQQPRSHSCDDAIKPKDDLNISNPFADLISKNKENSNNNNNSDLIDNSNKPILSLNTNPLETGVTASSLAPGCPSLSPDRTSLESPTLLKFAKDDKPHYYKEPLPGSSSLTNITAINSNINTNNTTISPIPSNDSSRKLTSSLGVTPISSHKNNNHSSTEELDDTSNTPPKSPSITINEYFH